MSMPYIDRHVYTLYRPTCLRPISTGMSTPYIDQYVYALYRLTCLCPISRDMSMPYSDRHVYTLYRPTYLHAILTDMSTPYIKRHVYALYRLPSMHAQMHTCMHACMHIQTHTLTHRLLELAALDGVGVMQSRLLSGRQPVAGKREELEQKVKAATETFAAYEELAKVQTIAEIEATLGVKIDNEEILREMEKLDVIDDEMPSLIDVIYDSENEDDFVQYDEEDVAEAFQLESDFNAFLSECPDEMVSQLAEQLQANLTKQGHTCTLDEVTLQGDSATEELMSAFGPDWQSCVRSCLREVHMGRDADEKDREETTLMDDAEEMQLNVSQELYLEDDTADEDVGTLVGLGDLTPKMLVSKILARNRRRCLLKAKQSDDLAAMRRTAGGERGLTLAMA